MVNRTAFRLGQLRVEFEGETAVVHGPAGESPEAQIESTEDALRDRVRYDDSGRYRPLPGAANLPTGWRVRTGPALPLSLALDTVYPLAMLHRSQQRAGVLRVVSLQDALQRQTGRYARAASLPPAAREVAAAVLCGRCVKRPVWRGAATDSDEIPCPEPCSVMVSLCRDAALWEAVPPTPSPVEPGAPLAAFETPGNEIREEYLRQRFATGDRVGLNDE